MVFEDLYKKNMFFKDDMFFFQKKHSFFFKKTWQKKHLFLMVDKTKQTLLFKSYYEYFSKKEKNVKSLFLLKTLSWPPMGTGTAPASLVLISQS